MDGWLMAGWMPGAAGPREARNMAARSISRSSKWPATPASLSIIPYPLPLSHWRGRGPCSIESRHRRPGSVYGSTTVVHVRRSIGRLWTHAGARQVPISQQWLRAGPGDGHIEFVPSPATDVAAWPRSIHGLDSYGSYGRRLVWSGLVHTLLHARLAWLQQLS